MTENKPYTKTEVSASNDNKWVRVKVQQITKENDNKNSIEEMSGVVDRIEVEKLLAEMNKSQ